MWAEYKRVVTDNFIFFRTKKKNLYFYVLSQSTYNFSNVSLKPMCFTVLVKENIMASRKLYIYKMRQNMVKKIWKINFVQNSCNLTSDFLMEKICVNKVEDFNQYIIIYIYPYFLGYSFHTTLCKILHFSSFRYWFRYWN